MTTGLDSFFDFAKGYRGVLSATLGGAITVLISELSGLTPPFPNGILQITAVAQLLVLIIVFQTVDRQAKWKVNKLILRSSLAFAILILIYVFVFNLLTYRDADGEQVLRGFSCTESALKYFSGECLLLSQEELIASGNNKDEIWTRWGQIASGMLLFFLWIITFCTVSFSVAVFTKYQIGQQKG